MRRKRKVIGEATGKRLSNRSLQSKRVGYGEVYSGGLANEALSALGARAMTVDSEIIVDTGFDPNRAEDQALYAHEMYHQEHSGGVAGSSMRDAEEISARAVESMVFHRAKNGESNPIPRKASDILKKDTDSASKAGGMPEPQSKASETPSADQGYKILKSQGSSHEDIVLKLTYKVIDELERKSLEGVERSGHIKGYLE
ncbi:MAG: DUF4157 domain-containing protein [Myxococcota bacterium]|nr:DUF4157 domain-containing protein [Myxococcota bacterium]